ncbi:MAG: ABC transporter permease [Chloroflexota bacterium]|nr:ABC transporter permease [Chloroflexota bacterium]
MAQVGQLAQAGSPEADAAPSTVRRRTPRQEAWRRFRRNDLALVGAVIALLLILVALFAPVLAPYDPTATSIYDKLQPPSASHPFGTDTLGRDVLSRIIYGSRVSLEVGLATIVFAVMIGVPLGAISGYWSGTTLDEVIMRMMDVLIAFPSLILAIAVMGALGVKSLELGPLTLPNITKVIFVIGLTLVPRFARVMRSAVLRERELQYVQAAECVGQSNARVLIAEIGPNAVVPIIVQATYYLALAILVEAALSFLGIGVQPPTPTWGGMLSESRAYLISGEWWYSVFPGLAILITMIAFNLLGDGLRDALDPRVGVHGR